LLEIIKMKSSRSGHGKFGWEEFFFNFMFFFGRGGEWVCERRTNYYVWRSVIHGNKCVQTIEHGRKLCVASSSSEVHESISMNKPLDSLLK
jgi:hypothetical protein